MTSSEVTDRRHPLSTRLSWLVLSRVVLSLVLIVSVAPTGCVMQSRVFQLAGGGQSIPSFRGYDLYVWVGNYFYSDPNDSCFIRVCQEYTPPAADTVRADSVCTTDISLLCVEFDCQPGPYCPDEPSSFVNRSYEWSNGVLRGPFYSFGPVVIPKKCRMIHVSFVATLKNRLTGQQVEQKTIRVDMEPKSGAK
jgi:hypothetical protein